MRKSIILVIALMVSAMTFAQNAERDYNTIKALIRHEHIAPPAKNAVFNSPILQISYYLRSR